MSEKMSLEQTPPKKATGSSGKASVGHPVDVATGTQTDSFEDYLLAGRMPLVLGRSYSSALPPDRISMFGPGWASPFEMHLRQDLDGYLMLGEDGEAEVAFDDGAGVVDQGGVVQNFGLFCELRRCGDEYVVTKWNPESQEIIKYTFIKGADGAKWPLKSKTDPSGQGIDIFRDEHGRVTEVKQRREGRGFRLDYNAAGRVTAAYLTAHKHERLVYQYIYDPAGRLSGTMDAIGQRASYEYNEAGKLIREVNIAGMVYHFKYDEKGRCFETSGLEGYGLNTLKFQDAGKFTEVTDALDNVTIFKWNEAGQVVEQISPMGNVTATKYDEYGRIVEKIEPTGAKTSYEFDERGDRVKVTTPTGAVTSYKYDEKHRILCVTDPAGHKWQRAYNQQGQIATVSNPLGQKLYYSYNGRGDLLDVRDDTGRTWTLRWNESGDLISNTDALGHATRYGYTVEGELVMVTTPKGNRTELKVDGLGRVVEVRLPDGAKQRMARNAYDQILEHVDEVGAVSKWRYAGCGLLVEEVRSHGGRIQYQWSNLPGQLLSVRNELEEYYRFEYDADGRMVKETDFAGHVTKYQYGNGKEATRIVNAAGERIELKRNEGGDLLEVVHSSGAKTKYEYDSRGLLTKADNGSCPIERDYDPLRRLVREKQDEHEVFSEYDAAGNRVRRWSSLGNNTFFEWDKNGRLVRHTPEGMTPLHFEYDEEGNETRRFVEGGVEIAHKYDSRGRRAEQRVGTTVDGWLERVAGGAEGIIRREYKYDAASNLTEILDKQAGTTRYEYDPAGRIISAVLPQGYSERFAYDAADNLREHVQNGIARQLSYGAGNTQTGLGGVAHQHDVLGQRILKREEAEDTLYYWDAHGMLAKVKLPDGAEWTYRYDALGRRAGKYGPADDVEFVWDEHTVLYEIRNRQEFEKNVIEWEFEQGGFSPVSKIEYGVRYICINDLPGIPRELITESGHIAWQIRTNVYGEIISDNNDEIDCPIRFPGQWHDRETNLYYNRFRYYDPVQCKYINKDLIGLIGGINPYSYTLNPIGWVDPFGLSDSECPIGRTVSQKQNRHIKGRKEWEERGRPSYFNSKEDAQRVLDAYHSGDATVLGKTKTGHVLVEFNGVTGFNNNPANGFVDQTTNRFLIKGSASPSVVPASPTAQAFRSGA